MARVYFKNLYVQLSEIQARSRLESEIPSLNVTHCINNAVVPGADYRARYSPDWLLGQWQTVRSFSTAD